MHCYRLMAKKHKNIRNKKALKGETVQGIVAIMCFIASIVLTLALFGKSGLVGERLHEFLTGALGVGYFMLPLILALFGVATLKDIHRDFSVLKIVSAAAFFD